MSFFEYEFPRKLSHGATGGDSWFTTVNQGLSGYESRNKNWATSLAKWNISLIAQQSADTTRLTDFELLRNWHLVVAGQGDAFRFFNYLDYKFTAAVCQNTVTGGSTADGSTTTFQLQKQYAVGNRTYTRKVTKPIMASVVDYLGNALTDTVVVYDNGAAAGAHTLDATTGIITFSVAPANGHVITADGQFHFPVRFASDEFKGQVQESNVSGGSAIVQLASVDLIEVRI